MAIGVILASATTIAFQDVASLDRDGVPMGLRWSAYTIFVPTGSTYSARMMGDRASIVTGSVQHRLAVKTLGKSSNGPKGNLKKGAAADQPIRLNRSRKGGRVVSSTSKHPPMYFTAGNMTFKQGMMERRITRTRMKSGFKKVRSKVSPVLLAGGFYIRKPALLKKIRKLRPKTMVARKVRSKLTKSYSTTLVAYAPSSGKNRANPFKSLFRKSGDIYVKPVLGRGDHKWAAKRLPKRVFSKNEQRCLAAGIYFEARGESVRGQAAVAQVILNRVKNPAYPKTICGVVYQNKSWKNRCQFSFACDGIRDRVRSKKHWRTAKAVARKATLGSLWIKAVGSSTHYHAVYVHPRWARTMKRMKRIGQHIFYRTRGGGWS